MNIYEKLLQIQTKLEVPKSQYNSFGKYHYRNCEDIQSAVKPLLKEVGATLITKDELVLIGERYYIKTTARLINAEDGECIENTAYAREEESKKGMDSAQITGSTSSYARKYALNGLFAIDDSRDPDSQSHSNQGEKPNKDTGKINKNEADTLYSLLEKNNKSPNELFNIPIESLSREQYGKALTYLKSLDKEGR